MCTAISLQANDHYFGRNLDLEYGYNETVTVTPRQYPLFFHHCNPIKQHPAFIGMATVVNNYPLYYEATNEYGLSVAALNFPQLAHYAKPINGKQNVAVFEFIPWLLSQFQTVKEIRGILPQLNLVDTPFSNDFPPTPLHFMVADHSDCLVLEPTAQGIMCYDNPIGVLTNAPEFPYHLTHLKDYQNLSPLPPDNHFFSGADLTPYSGAMGAVGLPGDWSSASRFVRAAFAKLNSPTQPSEDASVNQFFRILQSVAMPMGSVQIKPGLYDITRYSCCCNTRTGKYYYTTYSNCRITCVDMHNTDLSSTNLSIYPLRNDPDILKET